MDGPDLLDQMDGQDLLGQMDGQDLHVQMDGPLLLDGLHPQVDLIQVDLTQVDLTLPLRQQMSQIPKLQLMDQPLPNHLAVALAA